MMKNMKLEIGKIYKGYEVNDIEEQNANFDITEECTFKLVKLNKEDLYEGNLVTRKDWEESGDNYDNHHTDNIDWMIKVIRDGSVILPPIVIDIEGKLQDGTHRLCAYSEIEEIKEILVFKEIMDE